MEAAIHPPSPKAIRCFAMNYLGNHHRNHFLLVPRTPGVNPAMTFDLPVSVLGSGMTSQTMEAIMPDFDFDPDAQNDVEG